jgi:hypothetical protein
MELEGGEGSASRPGRSLPPEKTRFSLHRVLGGPQGRSGEVRKISPPPGFDPRTVQPVASRYNLPRYPAHSFSYGTRKFNKLQITVLKCFFFLFYDSADR